MRTPWFCLGLALLSLSPHARAEAPARAAAKALLIPYRLTATQHVLVRAKINGKGPFNFIIDTGAPALFVSTAVARQLGVEPDRNGWGTFDRFEIEGGAVTRKARARVEDPFQLEGMNGLNLAGAQLHGIIGYTVLARYRLEFDFTRRKMAWTPLAFDPPAPVGLGRTATPAGMDAVAGMMKVLGSLMGKQGKQEVVPRGFLGIWLAEGEEAVTVKAVLPGSPAAGADLKAGDRIKEFQGRPVRSAADLYRLAAQVPAGESVRLAVTRGSADHEVTVRTGEGF